MLSAHKKSRKENDMKKKIIAFAFVFLLGIVMLPFANGEQVRPRRTPISHQQPEFSQGVYPSSPQGNLSPQEIKEMQRQQEMHETQQRQEFEELKRQEFEELKRWQNQKDLEARQKLHDEEGGYYGGKFVVGSCRIEQLDGVQTYAHNTLLLGGIGMLGYRANPWVSLELEGGFYTGQDAYSFAYRNILTCMGQFYVDVPIGSDSLWKPYINVGIGGVVWGDDFVNSTGYYSMGLGVGYAMTKNTILDISFRYRDTLKRSDEVGIHFLKSYELITGMRYMF